jgi:hypothetical protein
LGFTLQIKSKPRQNSLRDFFLVLGVILLSKSLYYETYGGNLLLIGFFFILALVIIPNIRKLKVEKILLLYSFGLIALILINLETNYRSLFVLISRLMIAIMLIHLISFERFSKIFTNIILVLSVISPLALFVIHFDLPSALPDFNTVHEGSEERTLRNFILFGVDELVLIKYTILRATSIWWEPGAFQLFVNLAVIFSLINNNLSFRRYVIFAIAIACSLSTTGLIAFSILSLIHFKNYTITKKNIVFYLIPLFILILGSSFIVPSVYDKLNSDSFLSRYYDVIISIHMFSDNFFLGYGYGTTVEKAIPYGEKLLGYNTYHGQTKPSASDGITGFIAQVGILGFIFMYPFLFPRYCNDLKLIDSHLISLTLFVMFNTQNFTNILIFTVLTFYALIKNENSKLREIKNKVTNVSS